MPETMIVLLIDKYDQQQMKALALTYGEQVWCARNFEVMANKYDEQF